MLKTFKNTKTVLLSVLMMFLLTSNVSAQSIIYSSDQWPKRWERAVNSHLMDNYMARVNQKETIRHRTANNNGNGLNQVNSRGSWGKPAEKMRHQHKRSRTPEYHNGSHHNYDVDPLKRRYALPNTQYGLYGYGVYPNSIYGSAVPVIPHLPATMYPAPLYGGYTGIYPVSPYMGLGMPGVYTAPGYYPYGGFPGLGLPW